jgi:hypothetical protein
MRMMRTMALAVVACCLFAVGAQAKSDTGAQRFEVYDNTQDGLQPKTDPDVGNVVANANPGGKARLIMEVHAQKTAPNCTFLIELVRDFKETNGGLDQNGHIGRLPNLGDTQIIGRLTTNGQGNGNAHLDFDPSGDGNPNTLTYAHVDLEPLGTCTRKNGSPVLTNQLGAAPDPTLKQPFRFYE